MENALFCVANAIFCSIAAGIWLCLWAVTQVVLLHLLVHKVWCFTCTNRSTDSLINMQVLEDFLLQHNYQQVVYLGDGKGDYCPFTRLGPSDCILARQRYPDGSGCALPKLLADQGAAIKDTLQCLSSEGAPRRAASTEQNLQCPFPMAPEAQHTSAAMRCREQAAGAAHKNSGETQGAAKRHKGHDTEHTWGQGFCSSSQPVQAQISSEQPQAAEIDTDKCQDTVDSSTNQAAPCHDTLPLPSSSLRNQTDANKCRTFASVYTWSEAAEAAAMLHVLLSG